MDHRLAIVIVAQESEDPIDTSRRLLERFQKVPIDGTDDQFEPRFRYKQVGGWFDGLARGWIGEEQWSTVLLLLLSGEQTSEAHPLRGFGAETIPEITSRIESENTLPVADLWPAAPCSVVVTPSGEWFSGPLPDQFGPPGAPPTADSKNQEKWREIKRTLFQQYHDSQAVAWDISWHFIGASGALRPRRQRMPRPWGSAGSHTDSPGGLANGDETDALRQGKTCDLIEDNKAIDRWSGEGGAPSAPAPVLGVG